MVFDIYDEKPEKLKRKLAQFYHIRLKRGQVLAIPARDDAIIINVEYEQDAENNIPDICNDISRMYWIDRVEARYHGRPEKLISDRWIAIESRKKKKR